MRLSWQLVRPGLVAVAVLCLLQQGACGNPNPGTPEPDWTDWLESSLALRLGSVNPSQGPTLGGTLISVNGDNFQVGAELSINGVAASEVTVWSGTRLTAKLPRMLGVRGKVPVLLRNPDGQIAERSDLFAYHASQFVFPTQFVPGPGGITALAVGDFNGDDLDDIAVAVGATNKASVLMSNGQGGYTPTISFVVGTNPVALAIGDWNGDRKSDLAVANSDSNNVSVLLGDGVGHFSMAKFPVGISPSALAVGDFDGDRKLDLVVCNSGSNGLSVLLGDGQGRFAAAKTVATGTRPTSVAVADFNADAKLDLVVTNVLGGSVSVLLGDGRGGFLLAANPIAGAAPISVAANDLNGDRHPDLVVANSGDNSVSILLGNGTGGFAAARSYSTSTLSTAQPQSIQLVDYDGDQQLDLLVQLGAQPALMLGDGRGSFGAAISTGNILAQRLPVSAVGDFNGDRKPDLAIATSDVGLGISLNSLDPQTPDTAKIKQFVVSSLPSAIATGEFNGDGQLDLVYADDKGVQLTLGNGFGEFGTPTVVIPPPIFSIETILVADFSGDGKADIIAAGDTTVFLVQGDGQGGGIPAGTLTLRRTNFQVLRGLVVNDFNGDGIPDLILSLFDTTDVYLGDGKGGFRISSSTLIAYNCDVSGFAAGDYNGDQKQDVALSNVSCSDVDLFLSNGRDFTVISLDRLGTPPGALVAGDFNGDGKDDLVAASPGPSRDYAAYPATASLFLGGAFAITLAGIVSPPATPRSALTRVSLASVGDFNGDQNLDLLTGYHDFLTVYWGTGTGGFSGTSNFYPAPAGAASFDIRNAIVADFNQDQRPDVILSHTLNGTASILLIPNVGQ